MKNADIPAMPQDCGVWCDGIGACPTLATWLTKREMMAMHMMAGLNANPAVDMNEHDMATLSAICADALLAELELTKCQS